MDVFRETLSDTLDDRASTHVDEDDGLLSNRLQYCMIDEAPGANPIDLESDDSDSNQSTYQSSVSGSLSDSTSCSNPPTPLASGVVVHPFTNSFDRAGPLARGFAMHMHQVLLDEGMPGLAERIDERKSLTIQKKICEE